MTIVDKIKLVNNILAIILSAIAFIVIIPSILEDRRLITKGLSLRIIVIMITETAVMFTVGREFEGVYEINLLINTFNMIFNMVTTGLVAYYAYRMNEHRITKSLPRDIVILSIPIIVGCLFLVINLFTGIVFSVDKEGHFIRNSGVFIVNGIMILYSFATVLMVLLGKNKERNYLFVPIIILFIPIISGILIRSFIIPQVPVGVFGGSLALLIFALSTRHGERCFDPSTMAYNSNYFPHYFKRIDGDTQGRVAGIMICLDEYKSINSEQGQKAVDDMILKTTELINGIRIRHSALLRYKEDEFILLINNISNLDTIGEIMLKIKERFLQYEKSNSGSCPLSLSMGMTIYIPGEYTGSFVRRMTEQINPREALQSAG